MEGESPEGGIAAARQHAVQTLAELARHTSCHPGLIVNGEDGSDQGCVCMALTSALRGPREGRRQEWAALATHNLCSTSLGLEGCLHADCVTPLLSWTRNPQYLGCNESSKEDRRLQEASVSAIRVISREEGGRRRLLEEGGRRRLLEEGGRRRLLSP